MSHHGGCYETAREADLEWGLPNNLNCYRRKKINKCCCIPAQDNPSLSEAAAHPHSELLCQSCPPTHDPPWELGSPRGHDLCGSRVTQILWHSFKGQEDNHQGQAGSQDLYWMQQYWHLDCMTMIQHTSTTSTKLLGRFILALVMCRRVLYKPINKSSVPLIHACLLF